MTEQDLAEYEAWLGVGEVHRAARLKPVLAVGEELHIVSTTLFWKNVNAADPDLPAPTRELLVDARRLGLVKRVARGRAMLNLCCCIRLKPWSGILR